MLPRQPYSVVHGSFHYITTSMANVSSGCFQFNLPCVLIDEIQKLAAGQEVELCGTNIKHDAGPVNEEMVTMVTVLASKLDGYLAFSFHAPAMGEVFQRDLSEFWSCDITSMVINEQAVCQDDHTLIENCKAVTASVGISNETDTLPLENPTGNIEEASLIPCSELESQTSEQSQVVDQNGSNKIKPGNECNGQFRKSEKQNKETLTNTLPAVKVEISQAPENRGTRRNKTSEKNVNTRSFSKNDGSKPSPTKEAYEEHFSCEKSSEPSRSKRELGKQIETKHSERKPYKCSICGKVLQSKSSLKVHELRHEGKIQQTWKTCPVCDMVCASKTSFTYHMRIHTGEKPFECKKCGRGFRQHVTLQTHIRTHTGERPYVCKTCGKGFTQHTSMNKHLRIHRDERPYVCDECGKSFRDKQQLKQHGLIHSGEKPHVCKHCGKSFRALTNMLSHERIHTGSKPFVCSFCAKGFITKSHLVRHERIHTGVKPFTCSQCDLSFSQKETMRRHESIHGPEKQMII